MIGRGNLDPQRDAFSLFKRGNFFIYQQRERAVLDCLTHAGVTRSTAPALQVLEVGCGAGGLLPLLVYYGATPHLLHGVDIDPGRLREAKHRYPALRFLVSAAQALPFASRTYDIVVQSTLFTSILDPPVRRAAAAEMCRVLRPGGFIVWFDFRYNSPSNRRVRRVSRREIQHELFPGAEFHFVSTILLPPLARRIAPVSWFFAEVLSLFPPLRSHYCALIRPRSGTIGDQ
jgi:ubiquinone/menaquinone biosynthesis C-methylase UbiE